MKMTVRGVDDRAWLAVRHHPQFLKLAGARSVSSFGDSLGLVVLILVVAGDAGEALSVAVLLLMGEFLPSLLGPVTGALGDRFDRRRVMLVSESIRALAVLLIALSLPPFPVLVLIVTLRSVAGQVLPGVSRAVLPGMVPDRRLESANSMLGIATHGAEAVGPFAAAFLIHVAGVRGALLAEVACSVISAVLVAGLRPLPVSGSDRGNRLRLLSDARAGVRFMAATPLVRIATLGFVAVVLCNGVDDVALVFLARDSLQAGGSTVAVLYGAVGIGLIGGYLLLLHRPVHARLAALFLIGCAASSVGNLLTGMAGAIAIAFAVQLVRGLGLAAIDVGITTLLQREIPARLAARVFGTLYGAVGAAAAASYLFGILLLELSGPRVTFVVAGGVGLLATCLTGGALRTPQ
jgi:MFS family permease